MRVIILELFIEMTEYCMQKTLHVVLAFEIVPTGGYITVKETLRMFVFVFLFLIRKVNLAGSSRGQHISTIEFIATKQLGHIMV